MGRNQSKNRIGRFQRKRIHRAQLRDTYHGRVEREPHTHTHVVHTQIRNAIEFQNENVISTGRSARDSLYSTPMARARSRARLDAQYFDVLSLEWPVRADKVRPFVSLVNIYLKYKNSDAWKIFFSMYLCIYVDGVEHFDREEYWWNGYLVSKLLYKKKNTCVNSVKIFHKKIDLFAKKSITEIYLINFSRFYKKK